MLGCTLLSPLEARLSYIVIPCFVFEERKVNVLVTILSKVAMSVGSALISQEKKTDKEGGN